jgi:hypothetical protein
MIVFVDRELQAPVLFTLRSDRSRAWQFYIDDMIGFADKVIAYTNGLDQGTFVRSGLN